MTITVEDGTGLANADAYVSVAYVTAYATARGLTFAGTTAEQEQAIVKTTDYLDAQFRFQGARLRAEQSLSWPRVGVVDPAEGITIASNIVPMPVQRATAELAVKVRAGTVLLEDLDRGGRYTSVRVGPISISYPEGADPATAYGIIGLLKGLLRPNDPDYGVRPALTGTGDASPAFYRDQFANPSSVAPDPEAAS